MKVDTKSHGPTTNNKIIHQPRLGYNDSMGSTIRGNQSQGKMIPITKSRRKVNGPKSVGINIRRKPKRSDRGGQRPKKCKLLSLIVILILLVRRDSSTSSFGTFMLNQLDKRRGRSQGIGFIKPYRRKQMNKTGSNFNSDKLMSIKQIYIDSKIFNLCSISKFS